MFFFLLYRTKWKRQTAVGLELLAEAGNYAAVQRMLHTNPYWSSYGTTAAAAAAVAAGTTPGGIMSNLDASYLRHAAGVLPPQRPLLPRMFIHGLQQHINHMPPPQLYGPESRTWDMATSSEGRWTIAVPQHPMQHGDMVLCCINAGTTSATLAQYWHSIPCKINWNWENVELVTRISMSTGTYCGFMTFWKRFQNVIKDWCSARTMWDVAKRKRTISTDSALEKSVSGTEKN